MKMKVNDIGYIEQELNEDSPEVDKRLAMYKRMH